MRRRSARKGSPRTSEPRSSRCLERAGVIRYIVAIGRVSGSANARRRGSGRVSGVFAFDAHVRRSAGTKRRGPEAPLSSETNATFKMNKRFAT